MDPDEQSRQLAAESLAVDHPTGWFERLYVAAEPGDAVQDADRAAGPPWPLTRADVEAFATDGLRPVRVEEIRDVQQPDVRRWRAEFRRG